MIVLTVKKKENNVYELFSDLCSTISLRIVFVGIDKPNTGDKSLIHSDLIDRTSEIFTQPYVFMLWNSISIDEVKSKNDPEFIGVKMNGKYYCLKRMYG